MIKEQEDLDIIAKEYSYNDKELKNEGIHYYDSINNVIDASYFLLKMLYQTVEIVKIKGEQNTDILIKKQAQNISNILEAANSVIMEDYDAPKEVDDSLKLLFSHKSGGKFLKEDYFFENMLVLLKYLQDLAIEENEKADFLQKEIMEAAETGCLGIIKHYLKENKERINKPIDEDDYTLLHYAAIYNKNKILEYLLSEGADTEVKNKKDGSTPLNDALNHELGDIDIKVVFTLLKHKADVNSVDNLGYSPLNIAASCLQDLEITQLLLDHDDSCINLIDDNGDTPLMAIVNSYGEVDLSLIQLLLAHGSDLTIKNKQNKNFLELVREEETLTESEKGQIMNIVNSTAQISQNNEMLTENDDADNNDVEMDITLREEYTPVIGNSIVPFDSYFDNNNSAMMEE